MDPNTPSIADLTTRCSSTFTACLSYHSLTKHRWAENRLADFNLWADGVGALAGSRASLDSRFRSQSSELTLVKGILMMLQNFLDQCVRCAEGNAPVNEAMESVDSALENLALLAVAIRRTGRLSRLQKADRKFDPDEHSELESLLSIVLQHQPGVKRPDEAMTKFKGASTGERVLGFGSSELSRSQERLLQTNLRRRNRFMQAQRHSEGLKPSRSPEAGNIGDRIERSGDSTRKRKHANQQVAPQRAPFPLVEPTISGTSASTPASKLNTQRVKGQSSQVAITTITTLTAVARYPRPPKPQEGLKMFRCPCCCQTLPMEVAMEETRWKKHLSEDICPYTCLLENCPTPFATYATEHDWENHVKNEHPPRRLCPFCEDMSIVFSSMEAFLEHVQTEHADAGSENFMIAVMSRSGVITIGVSNCPLCDSTGPESDLEFIRHVLKCMHDFSLRSLPWTGQPPCGSGPVGTYNLECVNYDNIRQWLTNLELGETRQLQLSPFDDIQLPRQDKQQDYFGNNDYFDLESAQDSLEALERSSQSFSQQESDSDDAEEKANARPPFFIPSYLLGSQYILRLYAAHRVKLAAQSDTVVSASTPSRDGMTNYITNLDSPKTDDDNLLPPPSKWNSEDKSFALELINAGLKVQFTGPNSPHEYEAPAIRADNPMPPQCGIYYFEITIISIPTNGVVAIGFSSNRSSVERLPGWEQESWAYHSDDGKVFFGDSYGQGRMYGPTFTGGDTVGCGVNFATGSAFFTKNGVYLGNAFQQLQLGNITVYPSVGMKKLSLVQIAANFGQDPFFFDIDAMVERERFSINPDITEYQIGWICALPIEAAAAKEMLDEHFGILEEQGRAGSNSYTLGRIGMHYVVIACLPGGQYGTISTTTVVNNMIRTFSKSLRVGLMVGIGGGIPSADHDIRLGDVVISYPKGTCGGVLQHDMGKIGEGGKLHRTRSLNSPPRSLLTAVSAMTAVAMTDDPSYPEYIRNAIGRTERTQKSFGRPNQQSDRLFKTEYEHPATAIDCDQCLVEWEETRCARENTDPQTHYGIIASGNVVMRHGATREQLRRETGALCFEMDAVGLMLDFPCIVIRGICDYADSHKNKQWQGYAALAAASYAKELLEYVPRGHVLQEKLVTDICSK